MSDEVSTANSEAEKSSVGQKITLAQALEQRSARIAGQKPKETEAEKPTKTPEANADEATEEVEEKPKAVVSKKINLEDLSDEEREEIAEAFRSQAISRYGELTAKRKAAEEESARLKAELDKLKNAGADPLKPKVKDNPFKSVKTLEELQTKAEEVDSLVNWAEDLLDQTDGAAPDAVVAQDGGKEFTRAQVKQMLRNARKAKAEYLPAQLNELNANAQRKAQRQALSAQARKEIDWLGNEEESEAKKQYGGLIADPIVRKVIDTVPEFEPYMEYFAAHAVNSLYGRKPVTVEQVEVKRTKPPASPDTSAAQSESPRTQVAKEVKELEARAKKTLRPQDALKWREAQLTKRKLV